MRHRNRFFGIAAALATALGIAPHAPAADGVEPPQGFTALFNGKDLAGWHGRQRDLDPRKLAAMSEEERTKKLAEWNEDARKHWSVEGGDLVNDGHGVYLTTDKEYGDIELLIDYKTVPKADSGIYLRGTPQVQIWDATSSGPLFNKGAEKGSGGLFNNSQNAPGRDPLVLADKPFGEWNRFRIIQVGARTTVYLNDKFVVDHANMENYWEKDRSNPLFPRGVIQLQTHGGEIRWKNIYVREIPADEANKILASHGDKGFTSLFDGKTLEGWAPCFKRGGEVAVKDGEIRMPVGNPMTGITTTHDDLPRVDYELTYEAMRTEGADFFAAATFPVEEEFVTLVNGGWGGSITGLSRVNGADASENQTGGFVTYRNNTWYHFRVVVTDDVILCYIDDKLVVSLDHDDLELDTRLETRVNEPLGFSTWESAGALRKIQMRRLTEAEVEAANDVAD